MKLIKKIRQSRLWDVFKKWTQVTIHLHTGRNHSCHHPNTHPIPVHEVKRNPSNTS